MLSLDNLNYLICQCCVTFGNGGNGTETTTADVMLTGCSLSVIFLSINFHHRILVCPPISCLAISALPLRPQWAHL